MNALKFALRPDQLDLVKKVLADIRSGKYETLLAACPGFGKTEVAIEVVSKLVAEGKRVLVLAHATTVLRTNFVDRLGRRRPDLLEHPNVAVHIPQEHRRIVGRFDLVVVDEAHEFYEVENGLVERLVKKVGAQQVLLLTGTPFCFTRRGLSGHYVSLQELHEMGRAADLRIELAMAAFKLREEDWNSDQETRTSVSFSSSATARTMEGILKAYPRVDWKNGKTLIYCRSRVMAKHVSSFLTKCQIKHLSSFHEDGDVGQRVEDFRQGKAPVLVVVRRGRLGFDMPTLSTVIDLTMSRNPAVIFQMMCRLVRVPESNGVPEKTFIKAMPRVFSGEHLRYFMSGVLELSRRDLYTSYVGKVWELPAAVVERKGNGYRGTVGGRAPRFEAGMMLFGDYFMNARANAPGVDRVGFTKMWEALRRARPPDPEKIKAEVLALARRLGRRLCRKSHDEKESYLADRAGSYCSPGSESHDPEFRDRYNKEFPGRGMYDHALSKKEIFDLARRLGKRLRNSSCSSGRRESILAARAYRYCDPSNTVFDPEFRKQYDAEFPARLMRSEEVNKREILMLARKLGRRLRSGAAASDEERRLANHAGRYCASGRYFDAAFRNLYYTEFPGKLENLVSTKEKILEFARKLGRRLTQSSPNPEERNLERRARSYLGRSSRNYDPEFRKRYNAEFPGRQKN